MHLSAILLEPNAEYEAQGERETGFGGSKIMNHRIRLRSDGDGAVVWYSDGMLPQNDLALADSWEYLRLRSTATGRVLDLRLHTAAARNDVSMAREALTEGANLELRMKQGATPLHWAAAKGHYEVVELLVEHGADVNSADDIGWTPLFLAVQGGHQRVVGFLHENGATLEAVIEGERVQVTLERDWDRVLLDAAADGDPAGVESALENGADPNATTRDGWTALLEASQNAPDVVEVLLARGADPNLASDGGYTPLMRAAGHSQSRIVELLLAAGADPEMRDCYGNRAKL